MIQTLKMLSEGGNQLRLARIAIISVLEAFSAAVPFSVLCMVLFDIVDQKLTLEGFIYYNLIILVGAIFKVLFSYLNLSISRNDGNIIIRDLRLRLGEHIRKLSLGYFNKHDVGELSNKALDNVNKLEMILTMLLPAMISTLVLSLIVVSVLFFIDPTMAVATLITMPLALVILLWARSIMNKQGRALFESSNQLSDGLLEFVNGIKFIKSFNSSSHKLDNLIDKMRDFKVKSLKTEGTLSPVMVFTGVAIDFGLVMLICIGSYLMIGGELGVKEFVVFIVVSAKFFEELKVMAVNFVKVKYLGIAGESIRDVLNEKLLSGTDNMASIKDNNIEFKNVRFSYDKKEILKGVNLDIEENSMTAFVGPSGSGKTTMTNLIARFYDVDSGEIKIGSHNIKDIDPECVLQKISMVFQNVTLFNDTIYNNIKIGKQGATEEEIIDAAQKANVHDFISALPKGYQTMVGEKGANLSGGEQQRISIARAILKDSPIILLDEATASLDPENEIYIQNAFSNLLKNKTVIVIAHRLKTIKDADKIVVFNEGKICEQGSHDSLLQQKGVYYDLWQAQENSVGWTVAN